MTREERVPDASWMMLPSFAVAIAALYLAKGVLVPLALAVLLSFLLSPACDFLERRGLGRVPAVLTTAIVGFSLLGAVVWTAAVQVTGLAPKIPEYRENIEAKLNSVNEYAANALSKVTRKARDMTKTMSATEQVQDPQGTNELPFSVRIISSPTSPWQVVGGVFGSLLEGLGITGIVIIVVVFFLIRREDLRDRFIHLVGTGHVTETMQMLEDAGARVSRYLWTLFVLNVTFGISIAIGLSLIGIPNAILWGILAGTLRFIPYLGPWIAATMPIGLSMAVSSGWGMTLMTVGLFVVLELFSNNVLEPWLYGKNTGVSAVAVLVAAVFWTWLWGPIGLLLATPLTVCVLVVGMHVPQLSFLAILLGTEPVFEPKTRIYQRLLAGDQDEAAELFDEYLEKKSLVEVYDTVLVPALALAETHWQLGELHESKHTFIMQGLKEIIRDHGERLQEIRAKKEVQEVQEVKDAKDANKVDGEAGREAEVVMAQRPILCLPARTEADEVTALMLAQVLESNGSVVQAVSVASLAGEIGELVAQHDADVICLSATPPAAVMHARYLSKRIRDRFPNVGLVVGLWDAQGDLTKARTRIGCNAIVVATLAEAEQQIRQLSSGSAQE